tara:strand:- start:2837 stop:4267 length:1431 start_codon:yes stop_codon:yes gene_type:complete
MTRRYTVSPAVRNWRKKGFRSFEDAREFIRGLKLQNQIEWMTYCKSGKKPDDIPAVPSTVYKKEWKGVGDWLGTGQISKKNRNFRSFEDAREFARSLGLNGFEEWRKFIKSDKRPDDIPAFPNNVYFSKWSGWRDFLGPRPRRWRSFEDAREFARSLNFKSGTEWNVWKKSGKRPRDIPANPNSIYHKEWKGVGDWLGTDTVAAQDVHKNFLPFDDAKKIVHKLGFTRTKQWDEFCKAGKRPVNIPRLPSKTYKEEWSGMGDWLGIIRIDKKEKVRVRRNFIMFSEVKKFIQENNITGAKEWDEFCKAGKRPPYIPRSLNSVYKDEWKGWGDLTGSGRVALQKRKFRSFEDAREFARSLGLNGFEEWKKYRRSGKRPEDIPSTPDTTYKKDWKGWGDFLGTGRIANQIRSTEYLPWKEAKLIYQRLAKEYNLSGRIDEWYKFARKHKKLLYELKIPATPSEVYTKEREWKRSMKDD